MNRPTRRTFAVGLAALGVWAGHDAARSAAPDGVSTEICRRLADSDDSGWLAPTLVRGFYQARNCAPAWTGASGPPAGATELVTVLRDAEAEGLHGLDYHLRSLEARLRLLEVAAKPASPAQLARLDLQLTDAALAYAEHLARGRVDPLTIGEAASRPEPSVDLVQVLQAAVAQGSMRTQLASLPPAWPGYARLRGALAEYRRIAALGGWPPIRGAATLRAGDRGPAVVALRARLRATGDLPAAAAGADDVFDAATGAAVRDFETRHGFLADGDVEARTLAALNTTVERRISQIEVNLERQRWLPRDREPRAVLVNTAAFELLVLQDDRPVMSMRAIVGKKDTCTPELDDEIDYLVLNPAWEIPARLAAREVLPEIQRDPTYLERQGIKVMSGWGPGATEIAPGSVDWARITPQTLRFRLHQEPGPLNPLGRLKFVFPNHFDVYLHDTPAPGLFQRTVRSLSHGCVRIEHPIELAQYLLQPGGWSREQILSAIATDSERAVRLPEKIPVHLVYWTAWADEGGTVQFRDDIYGRDGLAREALDRPLALAAPRQLG